MNQYFNRLLVLVVLLFACNMFATEAASGEIVDLVIVAWDRDYDTAVGYLATAVASHREVCEFIGGTFTVLTDVQWWYDDFYELHVVWVEARCR